MTPTDTRLPPEVAAGTGRPDLRAHLHRVRTLRLAPTYVAAVAALRVISCVAAGAAFRTALVQGASTNVVNLTHGRLLTLLTSAFVLDGRACLPALLALGAVLGVAELAWGGLVLAAVFVYGHVVVTLLVFAGLVTGLRLDRLCESLAGAADVGPSYGGVAVVGALLATPTLPYARRCRVAAIVVALTAVLMDRTFTDVGHLLALLLGFGIGVFRPIHPAKSSRPLPSAPPSLRRAPQEDVIPEGGLLRSATMPARCVRHSDGMTTCGSCSGSTGASRRRPRQC